jgi:hypothetical protein
MNKLKTYAETQKAKPFNWFEWLNKKNFTLEELDEKNHLAGDWVTCACGNMCSILDREEGGEPKDEQLEDLGTDFSEHVADIHDIQEKLVEDPYLDEFEKKELLKDFHRKRKMAIYTLKKIEKRSQKLIDSKVKEAKTLLLSLGITQL